MVKRRPAFDGCGRSELNHQVISLPLWPLQAADQIKRLYDLFLKVDATQVEVNPLGETPEGQGTVCVVVRARVCACVLNSLDNIFDEALPV